MPAHSFVVLTPSASTPREKCMATPLRAPPKKSDGDAPTVRRTGLAATNEWSATARV